MPLSGVDVHFDCTLCGKCCHDLKLPLTVSEAQAWLRDGHSVQILCEAMPCPADPPAEDLQSAHRMRRSFAATSGTLPLRVSVVLAANQVGACPKLQADMRCGIYARRPLVCRIYPAELNPFRTMAAQNKRCPPEAWTTARPLYQRDGRLLDALLRDLIQQSHEIDARDVEVKRRVCSELGLTAAGLANEGYVVHDIDPERLAAALAEASLLRPQNAAQAPLAHTDWQLVSNRERSVTALTAVGAYSKIAAAADLPGAQYLSVQSAPP
jgi:Fe-S-cluster containining protein